MVLKTSVYKYNYIIFVSPSQLKSGKQIKCCILHQRF